MIVNVTQYHLDTGVPESTQCCPIALAIVDLGYDDVEVEESLVTILIDGEYVCFDLPQVAQDFIDTFDNTTGVVSPFSFPLEAQ